MESFIRWKTDDDYFGNMMAKKFGKDLEKNAQELKYQKNQVCNFHLFLCIGNDLLHLKMQPYRVSFTINTVFLL